MKPTADIMYIIHALQIVTINSLCEDGTRAMYDVAVHCAFTGAHGGSKQQQWDTCRQ